MNWDDAAKALNAPLDTKVVRKRSQGGASLSYIEGWHAIAEANRIFGFGEWSRETVDLQCVHEGSYKANNGNESYRCTYTAKVRVVVDNVTRTGCGAGHGFSKNPGEAHESALKEAETDAMKRALMTFGNPFGLALYDKQQTNVGDPNAPNPEEIAAQIIKAFGQKETLNDLSAYFTAMKSDIASLPEDQRQRVITEKDRRKAAIADNHQAELAKDKAA